MTELTPRQHLARALSQNLAEARRGAKPHLPPVVEHAIRMTSGAMQVRADFPDLERIFPLAEWIRSEQRGGGKVYRRVVVVVEDWEEVERG